ncbi:MAG TPA: metal-dependent hydrolase [Pyrinomonadaceae bacterium]|nr:metal-dependent hydrolase [Pyrinomonadaceae bacterium]
MDNFTHSLVGVAAAKAGLEKLSPGATVVCLLAANAPDADIVSLLLGDRWTYLHHHRGITHSIAGTLVIALLIPLVFYTFDRVIAWLRQTIPKVHLRGLTVASLLASATHPLMDWTNNYGVRPLLPWSGEWFYGDLVFIIDPFIWFLIGGATFLATAKSRSQKVFWIVVAATVTLIIMFAGSRPGAAVPSWLRYTWVPGLVVLIYLFRLGLPEKLGPRIPQVAFVVLLMYWGTLALLQQRALEQADAKASVIATMFGESVTDVAAMPTLANPLRWQGVVETERAAYRFELSLPAAGDRHDFVRHERPEILEPAVASRALTSRPARVFLGFARFPVARLSDANCTSSTLVQLADLRYTEPGSRRGTFSVEIPVECPAQVASGK